MARAPEAESRTELSCPVHQGEWGRCECLRIVPHGVSAEAQCSACHCHDAWPVCCLAAVHERLLGGLTGQGFHHFRAIAQVPPLSQVSARDTS